jgi:hypothetical protein
MSNAYMAQKGDLRKLVQIKASEAFVSLGFFIE